jgi:hypothetical protein
MMMILTQVGQSQESALLDLLGGGEPSAAPVAPASAPASSGDGTLLDLLNLDIQQPTPAQPGTGGGADLGAGLLDLLGAPTPAPTTGLYCTVYVCPSRMRRWVK